MKDVLLKKFKKKKGKKRLAQKIAKSWFQAVIVSNQKL
jgi:hypothetical protein